MKSNSSNECKTEVIKEKITIIIPCTIFGWQVAWTHNYSTVLLSLVRLVVYKPSILLSISSNFHVSRRASFTKTPTPPEPIFSFLIGSFCKNHATCTHLNAKHYYFFNLVSTIKIISELIYSKIIILGFSLPAVQEFTFHETSFN